jgi:hypothetical protein
MSLLDTASLIVTPNGYKEGKLYSVIPSDGSGDMSVTRATTATRVNSAGLVELVPYNLLQYSEQFNNGVWTPNAVSITANSAAAPDGTTTADKIILANGSQTDPIVYQILDTNSSTRTLSFFAKASEYNIAFGRIGGASNSPIVLFQLSGSGSILHNQNVSAYSIEALSNGWYRCSMTYSHGASFAPNVGVCSATYSVTTSSVISTGNGTSGIFIWGAQVVEGSTAKDYQKTETRLNIPRLDYSNGTCPSLLVEPQRTNLAKYSSSFDTSPWITTGISTITPNTTIAPDGTQTADTLLTDAFGQLLYQAIPASTNTTYTISVWAKLGTATNLCLVVNNAAAWNTIGGQSFDATDGLNTSTWTRISYTFTTPSTLPIGVVNFHIGANNETGLTQSAGTAFIWGAQLEAGSYATSYIPTTSASVTRNADVVSKTGISSLIGQTEGTMFVDVYRKVNSSFIFFFTKTTTSPQYFDSIYLYQTPSGNFLIECIKNGVTQFSLPLIGGLNIGLNKIALAYSATDTALYVNGFLTATDNSATIPEMNNISINGIDIENTSNMGINAFALWKQRLTNTQLAQLTTI